MSEASGWFEESKPAERADASGSSRRITGKQRRKNLLCDLDSCVVVFREFSDLGLEFSRIDRLSTEGSSEAECRKKETAPSVQAAQDTHVWSRDREGRPGRKDRAGR